ncbi:hypothetical protein CALVIDRAFT_479723 [Calocera viscosa TUFC12733]|uniref:Tf2-1-like SH3-like domain-containing protein n=1 Tax=Calocera viscosa (strain TUFC12733) TaxID=1330018 RepID=A0A167N9Y8_CALVF|nr:hypothetical protein CALVIDRAFT_479723 [Calocera viscosa TUFC12733]
MLNTKNQHAQYKVQGKKRSAKLLPCYDGPWTVIKAYPETSTYKLSMPDSNVHPVFHGNLLCLYTPNDPELFPNRDPPRPGPVRYSTRDRDRRKRRDVEANTKETQQSPCLGHMTMILEQIAEQKGKDRQKVYNVSKGTLHMFMSMLQRYMLFQFLSSKNPKTLLVHRSLCHKNSCLYVQPMFISRWWRYLTFQFCTFNNPNTVLEARSLLHLNTLI